MHRYNQFSLCLWQEDKPRRGGVAGAAHHMLEWAASGSLELVLKLKLIVMSLHKELQCKARGKKKQQRQRRAKRKHSRVQNS